MNMARRTTKVRTAEEFAGLLEQLAKVHANAGNTELAKSLLQLKKVFDKHDEPVDSFVEQIRRLR
jgi:hypothetical protein